MTSIHGQHGVGITNVFELSQVDLRFFSDTEIRKLSVCQVHEPRTYDQLMHPVSGGLYDPKMGPISEDVICVTCREMRGYCPGHMGHISLPFPVCAPRRFSDLTAFLNSSCPFCERLRIDPATQFLFSQRMKLINAGLPHFASKLAESPCAFIDGLYDAFFQSSGDKKKDEESKLNSAKPLEFSAAEMRQIEEKVHKLIVNEAKRSGYSEKNLHEYFESIALAHIPLVFHARISLQNEVFKSASSYCPHCGDKNVYSFLDNRVGSRGRSISTPTSLVYIRYKGGSVKHNITLPANHSKLALQRFVQACLRFIQKRKDTTGSSFSNDLEQADCILIHPDELYEYARRVWTAEEAFLNSIFQLASGETFDFSVYFQSVVAVPANRFRPPEMRGNNVTESVLHRMYRAILTTCADIRDEMTKSSGLITDRTVEYLTQLQTALTCVIDCNNDPDARLKSSNYGIKQIVEKKKGLFRGHMMGKRVNFCARTVILPDPMISTSEINIPLIFAQKLSFPETVNDYNIDKMRRLVKNGADLYPGADGVAVNGLKVSLAHMPYEERKALSKVLKKGVTVVHRHIQDGDLFLVNRQPSLHRNSMMAHSARIITNQRTLRIHYANCKSYNADFDGDEMNIHIPQDYISQSELKEVVMNETQYVSATSGEPLRGLIQDHVVAGVLLTLKNRVFDKEEYNTLVYGALFHRGHKHKIVTVPPAMLKPKMLWTGKQVISTILKDVAEGRPGINLDCACKLKNCWGGHNEENNVIIRDNEVLTGVFDKNQIGASLYGIVHAFDEIYGHLASAELLTCITRLCTLYLQYHGFSCGIDDLMVTDECNKERRIKLEKSDIEHRHATAKFAGLPREDSISDYDQHVAADNISRLLQVPKNIRRLDSEVKAVLQSTTSELTKKIVPDGLLKPFPRNCMTMMTQSGAKGSLVNASQISSALGLQEFEGSRVKPNIAGKTLPSFERHDMSAMAGGFVASRFLSGIKPQEYYFHCMAGRIGLIDTAVKTARSGYLQRCLIKNLEDLVVKYDGSIRNLSNCIVQFRYGGDGIDTNKVAFMHRHEIIAMNHKAYCNKYRINEFDIINHTDKRVLNYKGKDPMISSLDLSAWSCLGLVSETFQQSATQFIESSPLIKSKESKVKSSLELVADKFKRINNERFQRSLVEPGEAVGVLAGQSIGEPSTQMTLNTFHFAGLDMAHVTVGIPRLTELLMTGTTRAVVTTVPVRAKFANSPDEVKKFANSISSVLFSDVVKGVTSKEEFFPELGNMNRRVSITIQFDMEELTKYYHIKPASFWNVVKVHFVTAFDAFIRRRLIGVKNRAGIIITRASVDARAVMTHLKSTTFEENESYDMLDGDDMESAPFKKQSKQAEDYDDEAQSDDEDETMQDEPEAMNNEPEEKQEPIQELLEATSKNSGVETRSSWLINRQQGTLTITLANTLPRVFIKDHVMAFCKATHIRHYQGIEKVNVIPKKSGGFDLQLEGFTLSALSTMPASYEFLDFNNLITSSVPLVAETFGIEAAYKHIVNEILMVFKMYGITVDERHISLIADYMCHTGVYSACNRHTMKRNPGPMHKASFESALTALNESVKHLESDPVNDPSSQLIFGKPVTLGTGCFDVLVPFSQE